MKVGRCSHLHFIQSIRDGEVIKVLNVSGGRPGLVFKTVYDVYGPHGAQKTIRPPSRATRKVPSTSEFHPEKVKVEASEDHLTTTDELPEFSSSTRVDAIDYDLDDMTLNQIKQRWQLNKRKQSAAAFVNGVNVIGSCHRDSVSNSQNGEEEYDPDEPLAKLKSILKRNIRGDKRKSKKRKKHVASSFENAIVAVKTEETWFDDSSPEADWDSEMPLALRVEVPEYYHSGYETMALVPSDCSIADYEQEVYYILSEREELQQADECISIAETSLSESSFENAGEDKCKCNSGETILMEDILETRGCMDYLQMGTGEEVTEDPIPLSISRPLLLELADAKSPFDFETRSTSSFCNDSTSYYGTNPAPRTTTSSFSSADVLPHNQNEMIQESCAHVENISPEDVPPSDAIREHEHVTLESAQNKELPKLQHPFRRLFSTRKVISPTSQERLRKAMSSNEFSEEEIYKCRGKLYLRKHGAEKLPGDEIVGYAKSGDLNGTSKKRTNDGKGSPPQSIQKVRQISSLATSRMKSECNTMRTPSENAIAFSQRQMQDIENLTAKLIVELKSVKEIAEEASRSGVNGSVQSKFGPDEIQGRIENATRIEETAKRWLSMMGRDCSRFCKIMRLTENRKSDPEIAARKQLKKVCFADESGSKLCHVQYI